jgi:hypothetical protein
MSVQSKFELPASILDQSDTAKVTAELRLNDAGIATATVSDSISVVLSNISDAKDTSFYTFLFLEPELLMPGQQRVNDDLLQFLSTLASQTKPMFYYGESSKKLLARIPLGGMEKEPMADLGVKSQSPFYNRLLTKAIIAKISVP